MRVPTLRAMDVQRTPPSIWPLEALSRREHEVLSMTSGGLSNREIAQELQVTVHAVKFHLASIFRKLDVANRTEAAVIYTESVRLVDSPARR